MTIPTPLPPCPDLSRAFTTGWPVRWADTDADDRLRLDTVARYLQDIGYEHLSVVPDGANHPGWIVRRTVIDVLAPIGHLDRVTLHRWSSGLSNRWCNMRIRIDSESGGRVETEAFLIHVDTVHARPKRMSDEFMAPMLAHTTEHRLRWKAALAEFDPARAEASQPFQLRVSDVDRFGHVNNAVYWQAVEEQIAKFPGFTELPYRAIVEHVGAIMPGDTVDVRARRAEGRLDIQVEAAGKVAALARVEPTVSG